MDEREFFLKIQNSLKRGLACEDMRSLREIHTVAGVDLAYWTVEETEFAVCCVVVLDIHSQSVIETRHYTGKVEVPYYPGFLAFRELPLVLKTVELLESQPDLYMFDGNGYLHPRHMGIASHASFYLKTPTIGVAKTFYRFCDELRYTEPENEEGAYSNIIFEGEILGRALRTRKNVKPVFLSPGNYISLDTATLLTLSLTGKGSHIPLPTRLADIETHKERSRQNASEGQKGEQNEPPFA